MRKRWRKWVGLKCWDIGDWFMGQYFKRIDREEMETWPSIDVHANCQPKGLTITPYRADTSATGLSTNWTVT